MDQTNKVYSNNDQGRVYLICKFMTHGAAVLMVGRDHISHHSDMHYLLFCQYSIIERDCDAASYAILEFYSMIGLLIGKY